MKMEMQIIASHIVKPSSPTPVASKHHKLSSLDQVAPPVYIPLIFFYEHDKLKHQHEQISRRLKQSLSETLTIFYPLAGSIKQNSFVDCDDRGAEFVEARVHGRPLAQLIQNPKMEDLMQLIPIDSASHNDDVVLSVKTNYFDCGGNAVGVCFSHKLGDTSSFATFMNAWAATCRGESSRIIPPSFDMSLHFPPRDPFSSGFHITEKPIAKRLVFEREKLEKLKKQTAATSRVEAVSAFIWRCFIDANKARTKTTTSVASHMVNLRPRTVPPMPDPTFGNCFAFASAVASEGDDVENYASKFRAAIRAVDDDYINLFIKSGSYFDALEEHADNIFKPGNCTFTSWWKFPVYDVDFGWGKPVWVSPTTMPFNNGCLMTSTSSGDGIEALITVPDEDFFQFFQLNYNKLFN